MWTQPVRTPQDGPVFVPKGVPLLSQRSAFRLRRAAPHVVLGCAVLAATLPGVGWRHLWVDEVDTAERAKAVLAHGYPRLVDEFGEPSLNTAGREIEDGDSHRFSPWAQFYVGAVGLALGRVVDAPPDTAVRVPFVVGHAAVSAMASYGLTVLCGVPLATALAAGGLLGLQTARVVYNRQARYQPLLDFLAVLGLLGLAAFRAQRRWGAPLVAAAIFLLPHTHSMSGSVCSLVLGLWLAWTVAARHTENLRAVFTSPVLWGAAVLPGLAALVTVLLLTRPWLLGAWAVAGPRTVGSLDNSVVRTSLLFAGGAALALVLAHQRREGVVLASGLALSWVVVALLDLHPMSTARYYVSLNVMMCLWPLAVGLGALQKRGRLVAGLSICACVLLPDLVRGWQVAGNPLAHQGIRLVVTDVQSQRAGVRQPLHQVVDYLRTHAAADAPVLFDAVPQYANWYLPGHPVALMPDASAMTSRNRDNPLWQRPLQMPAWHIWYPTWGSGPWTCTNHCDYVAEYDDPSRLDGPYWLSSKRLGTRTRYCPVAGFPTARLNNAPYQYLATASVAPEGLHTDLMVVAQPCSAQTDVPQAPHP